MKTTNISSNNMRFTGKKIFNSILTLVIAFSIPVLFYLQLGYPVQKNSGQRSSLSSGNTVQESPAQQDKSVADIETAVFK